MRSPAERPLCWSREPNPHRTGTGDIVTADVRDLLRRHPGLNDWIEQLLEDDELVPPHLQPDVVRSYRPVPDSRGPISATKYVCPTGDGFTWYRSPTARPMACCPICGSAPGDGGDRY